MSVTLREKVISGGRLSLYLDINTRGFPRRKEFLGIYVFEKPRGSMQRDENAKLYQVAELKLSERRVEIAKFGGGDHGIKSTLSISDYCRVIGKGKKAEKTKQNWHDTAYHLDKSGIGEIITSVLSVSDCLRFRSYLTSSKLAQSTQNKYFGLLKTALRQAHLSYVIPADLHDRLDSIPRGHATKEFLRQSELDKLFSTPVRSRLTRQAFLFSCLTGMRHSDIKSLKWKNVYDLQNGRCELRYIMQKTGKAHVLPIGSQARDLLGDKRGKGESPVLGVPAIQTVNRCLHGWAVRAGISKKVTFHVGRHTFATLALSAGVPLKVVSDYLGHSSVVQTEVYARLLEDERDRYVGRVGLTVASDSPPALRLVK